jgi:hypothetical protein
MNLEIIVPDSIANNEEYKALFTLFEDDNLEKFFENLMEIIGDSNDPMLDVYLISEWFNDFISVIFLTPTLSLLKEEKYLNHAKNMLEAWHDYSIRIKRGVTKWINKLPPTDELPFNDRKEQLTKKVEEILQLTKKIDKQTEHEQIIPDYIKKLVENGYVKTDGITAIASLDDIAEFLYSLKLDSFNFKTLLQLHKPNGEPFAENSAIEAVKRANRT